MLCKRLVTAPGVWNVRDRSAAKLVQLSAHVGILVDRDPKLPLIARIHAVVEEKIVGDGPGSAKLAHRFVCDNELTKSALVSKKGASRPIRDRDTRLTLEALQQLIELSDDSERIGGPIFRTGLLSRFLRQNLRCCLSVGPLLQATLCQTRLRNFEERTRNGRVELGADVLSNLL